MKDSEIFINITLKRDKLVSKKCSYLGSVEHFDIEGNRHQCEEAVEAVEAVFSQEKALLGAFFVIIQLKTLRMFVRISNLY